MLTCPFLWQISDGYDEGNCDNDDNDDGECDDHDDFDEDSIHDRHDAVVIMVLVMDKKMDTIVDADGASKKQRYEFGS